MGTVKFRVHRVRSALLAGILEVWGHSGFWPLRKPVTFRVGANCDEIRIAGSRLLVLVGRRLIAKANYTSKAGAGGGRDPNWERHFQPRDQNKR